MIIKLLHVFFITSVLLACSALGALFFFLEHPWVDFSILEYYRPGKPSIVYDQTGTEWTRFQLDKRDFIALDQIPQSVINAFLAAEDWNFFNHPGISIKGIIRSSLVNLYYRRKVQGASTITQQLAKLLFFDSSKSYTRKIKEQLVALSIERQFTKEKILETYLNHVCFGCGIYGVEAASQRFWGKNSKDITVDQAALLAGILRCPQKYCPLIDPQSAEQRRNVVLNSMHKLSFISAQQYTEAKSKAVTVIKTEQAPCAPHLREALRLFLEEIVGKQKLYSGGLTIQTTLNLKTQEAAELSFKAQLAHLQSSISPQIEGALIALDGATCAIRALVGGSNFTQSQFNRAFKAKRQMGSIFKPIIYAAALESGLSLADTAIDEPITLVDNNTYWSPQNFNHTFEGSLTLAAALSYSNNIIAIKTLLTVGAEKVIALALKCGITETMHPYPSLGLGCVDGTAQEAAALLNIFAHSGIYRVPYFIEWIKDEWDTKIWRNTPEKRQAISSAVSSQVAKALTLSMQRFKKRMPNHWLKCQTLGKTGTTNDARTCWFTGATPELTTAVYIGRDDNQPLGNNVLAVKTAFPIWLEFNKLVGCQTEKFNFDSSLREVIIDEKTGYLSTSDNPHAITIFVNS